MAERSPPSVHAPVTARRVLDRYELYDEIASGGMASVHLARLQGSAGIQRVVAIKRLHPHYAKDAEFCAMLIDEGRLASRIRHPNVVSVMDAVSKDGELFLVMEYVLGETLGGLLRAAVHAGETLPPPVAAAIVAQVLRGLHAAHEARSERGEPLCIVHRDVSPQNILIGDDGIARVLDFGIAKASDRIQTTRDGDIKGKVSYMAPEQLQQGELGPFTDVYASAVVLWEALTGRRLFEGAAAGRIFRSLLREPVAPPSSIEPAISAELDAIVLRGTSPDPADRFASAAEMAAALEATGPAPTSTIAALVQRLLGATLAERRARLAVAESETSVSAVLPRRDRHAEAALTESTSTSADGETTSLQLRGARRGASRWQWYAMAAVSLVAGSGLAFVLVRSIPDAPASAATPSAELSEPEQPATNPPSITPSSAPVASLSAVESAPQAPPPVARATSAARKTAPSAPRKASGTEGAAARGPCPELILKDGLWKTNPQCIRP